MMKRIGPFAIALSLIAIAAAQASFSLARKPKLDQTIRYQVRAVIDLAGTEAVYTAVSTDRIVELGADGSYTIITVQSNVRTRYGERDFTPEAPPAQRIRYGANGEILDVVAEGERAHAFRIAAMSNLQISAKELKTGDKWTVEIKPSANTDQIGGKANYELTKIEEVEGIKAAAVKFSYAETSGVAPASSEGTLWISVEDGSLVKSEVSMKNVPFPDITTPVDAKMTVTRLPAQH